MQLEARGLWHEAAGVSALRAERLAPGPGDVVVRTRWSGISRGTERLVADGRVPEAERARMRAPMQAGDFPFPVKYGYAAVGVVEHGPADLLGRSVFALHPHQDVFVAPAHAVVPLPPGLPERRATLSANMETALNAVWDGALAPGDRVAVVGAGALGLMVASIAARTPAVAITLLDVVAQRGDIAAQIGVKFEHPRDAPGGCDIAFHTSATAAGLRTAMACLGDEGTLVEMSWHGEGDTPVALGGAFHSRRLRLISSQVGALPAARRARWDFRRRLEAAMALLGDDRLDALITGEVAFDALPGAFRGIVDGGGVATAVRY